MGSDAVDARSRSKQALEFGASAVFDVEFHGLLSLSGERPLPVEVKLEGTRWTVSSATSTDYSAVWPIKASVLLREYVTCNSSSNHHSTTAHTRLGICRLIRLLIEDTLDWIWMRCVGV